MRRGERGMSEKKKYIGETLKSEKIRERIVMRDGRIWAYIIKDGNREMK